MNIPGIYDTFLKRWSEYQTIHIISDTHFDDEELAVGLTDRPSDEALVKMINSKVGRKDILIHLGDVGNIEFAKQLRGHKILIMGNHDSGKTNYTDIFDEVYSGALLIGEKLILSHEPVDVPWAFNIHGHIHDWRHKDDKHHKNVCADVIGYTPINLNQFMKTGPLANIESIHRTTINKATKNKRKRGGKKISVV